ncbi:ATP-binding cassette domain-containing protein [Actinoplanes sp. NPDC051494]|uniref:ATP-binding cassette domain-containing protein n=1 Tax=Actinoplanes sp. NPDC051494 TaxID=3363907 RepID=UPI00378EDC5B
MVTPGLFAVLATARTADAAAIVDRLGGYGATDVTWGGERVDTLAVRDRVLVADPEAYLFTGTLGDVVAGRFATDFAEVEWALAAASAGDLLRGLPDGAASVVADRGSNLSGGQRQRVRLARALLADPEILLAVEPTSAVDAHTEAAMAERLRAVRAGRTTLVTTTSPAMLDRADVVYYLVDGRVAAAGTHRELLGAEPGYRALVTRTAGAAATTGAAW